MDDEALQVVIRWRDDTRSLRAGRLRITETLSEPYTLSIKALVADPALTAADLVGEHICVAVMVDDAPRPFWGRCTTSTSSGWGRGELRMSMTLHPWLWLLGQGVETRVFQDMTAPQIAAEVFSKYRSAQWEANLTKTHRTHHYIVQHDETDLQFLNRVFEDAGIYYHFRHDAGGETLVLCDGRASHEVNPLRASVPYAGGHATDYGHRQAVQRIAVEHIVLPNRVTKAGKDFEKVDPELEVSRSLGAPPGLSDVVERYDHVATHKDVEQGEADVRRTIDALGAGRETVTGETNLRAMAVGYRIALTDHPVASFNREYYVTACTHHLDADRPDDPYRCSFRAIPTDRPYRPPARTPRPRIHSLQTATVVGPPGEEIHTDRYGRIKVQFDWDRRGSRDERSSCWVRVATSWAGRGWGSLAVPRIGQEVVVQFENGDPDRPIVTGMLFNAKNMPPVPLPGGATRSGLRSDSSPGGNGANLMEMEDAKGREKLTVVAERDHSTTVKNDATVRVGYEVGAPGSYTFDVKQDRTETVSDGDYKLDVETGNRTATVKSDDKVEVKGSRSEVVTDKLTSEANHVAMTGRTDLKAKSPDVEVDGTTKTRIGSAAIEVDGTTIKVTGLQEITLTVGGSSIVLNAAGVTIKGALVKLN